MTRWVGSAVNRPEGRAKVDGSARYVADESPAGHWVGGVVRSRAARGRLERIERARGFDFARVVVLTPADLPADNVQALIEDDQPILCEREIQHFGEALALVAAPDAATLAQALEALVPRIEELPPVLDMEASAHAFAELAIDKGDVDAAFARAPHVFEGTYRTDSQEQLYIETQGMIADPPDADGVFTVRGSLQCPHYVQKALCRALGVDKEHARVVQCETGGGFGGKEEYPSVVACHAALLARASGRTVRMIYDRHEDLAVTPKRHPSRVRHRTAVDRDGTLLALDVDVLFDGGAYTTLSPVVLSRGVIHAAGPYACDNVRIRGRVVQTNHPPYGAFRGFGAPQTCFAIERQLDRVARGLGIHPVELRRRNMLEHGDTTATGQKLEVSVGSTEVMRRITEHTRIDRHPWCAPKQGRKRRGIGFSFFFHGAGFTGSGEEMLKGRVTVELDARGHALVRAGSTEIGQGTNAMFVAIAAESLGIPPEHVTIARPDTSAVPDSGPTVASRTCMVIGGCLQRACAELRRTGASSATVTYESPKGLHWDSERYRGDAYPVYGWAADVAEVEVDLATFEVEVVRFICCADVGRAIQPALVEGQLEGGSLQAVGWAHLEVVSTAKGRFLQDRLATCVIPTTLDAPPFEVLLVEVPFPHGPFGAKGVGELPMDGGAPALCAAIEDALGIHMDRVPATPERLLEAWLAQHPEEAL